MNEIEKGTKIRGKIVLEYKNMSGLPEVKFFGHVRARDIQMTKMSIQRAWRLYMLRAGKKEIQAHDKAIETERKANKEKKNESNTDRPTKEGSGSVETSSTGSGSDTGQGSGGDILTPESRSHGDDGGADNTVQPKAEADGKVLPEGAKDSEGKRKESSGRVQSRGRDKEDT
jgi:hypothetical protein